MIKMDCDDFADRSPPSHRTSTAHPFMSLKPGGFSKQRLVIEEYIMSFLNIMIPVETVTSLIEDIRKQIDVGRLETTTGSPLTVDKPTRELSRLNSIFQTELKVLNVLYSLILVTHRSGNTLEPSLIEVNKSS